MKRRALAFVLGFTLLMSSAGCQFGKPFEGSGHSKDGTTYTVTIETEDVWTIGIGNENASSNVENADHTAFEIGHQVEFEGLDFEDGEEIIWSVADQDGNVIETTDQYHADGKHHNMVVNEERYIVEQ